MGGRAGDLGKPEWPARFCFAVSRARCGILHAASQNRDPGLFEQETGTPDLQRTTP
jgi:hypothetical protein